MYKIGPLKGDVEDLKRLFEKLASDGYEIVGPKIVDGVIRLVHLKSFDEIATNVSDIQEPGSYKLVEGSFFRHGLDAPKRYLYPPSLRLYRIDKDLKVHIETPGDRKIAFFGIKPCDSAAIAVQEKVFEQNGESYFLTLRKNSIIIVENCIEPGNTCFCATMGTGPKAVKGFDISYTKIDGSIVFEAGSEKGLRYLEELNLELADSELSRKYLKVLDESAAKARADFTTDDLPEQLELGMESPIFKEIAEKCLGCANCNLVCPTCFCFDVYDVPNLDGSADRIRVWDGCLTYKYALVSGGNFRPDLWARYRHWLLHKFSFWVKQFETFGCVGCGRCITWCPVGIDVRESVSQVLKWVRENVGK
jgi:ferredoxin